MDLLLEGGPKKIYTEIYLVVKVGEYLFLLKIELSRKVCQNELVYSAFFAEIHSIHSSVIYITPIKLFSLKRKKPESQKLSHRSN